SNTIGGTSASARNIISANVGGGVGFFESGSGNLIEGNYIGTDVTGTQALGSQLYGIVGSTASSGNTFGGTVPGAGNLISGNINTGIYIYAADSGNNLIAGNYIGTNAAGTAALANGGDGVFIASSNNTIGGTAPGAGNLVSGNAGVGIRLTSADATG